MGKSSAVTVGYWYFMDVLTTLFHTDADTEVEISEIQVGERTAWAGSVTESQTISISELELFGGEDREGGVEGFVDVMMGGPAMSVNSFLGASARAAGITGPIPAYRGVCSLFFRGSTENSEFSPSPEFEGGAFSRPLPNLGGEALFYPYSPPAFRWTAFNPYFKKFRVKARSVWKGWYPEKAVIGRYSNPIHIMVQCFTNFQWGMGYPLSELNDERNRQAADVLVEEGFGLGLEWNAQTSIEEFIQFIAQHINAALCQDRVTGENFFKLIRADYDVNNLLELGPHNCVVDNYSRPGFGETVNEVVLKFVREDGRPDSITVHDIAGINSLGQVVSQTIELPGIRSAELAARVAQRELNARSQPISKFTIRASRYAFPLYEGDVFILTWPAHGLISVVCRVIQIDLGTIEDNTIVIEAIEDVFNLANNTYVAAQPVGWVNPTRPPEPTPVQYATEASYMEVLFQVPEADRPFLPQDFGFATLLAARPQNDSYRYTLAYSPDGVTYAKIGQNLWTPTAVTSVAVPQAQGPSQFAVESPVDMHKADPGDLGYLGDEMVQLISYEAGVVEVGRGVVDTVPQEHPAGTRLWFFGDVNAGRDPEPRVSAESATYKLLTKSSQAELPLGSAPASSLTFSNRFNRPYPPARLVINGQAYPAEVSAASGIQFQWSHRDRIQQADQVVTNALGSVGPEEGVTYRVRIYQNGLIVNTFEGITAPTFTYTGDQMIADEVESPIQVVIDSQRDGLDSWQAQDVSVNFINAPLPPEQLDPHWADVKALLHFEGADQSTTFIDQKGSVWAAVGTAKLQAAGALFGQTSLKTGATNSHIATSSTGIVLGSGDYTVELWFMLDAIGGGTFVSSDNGTATQLVLGVSSDPYVYASIAGNQMFAITPQTVPVSAWRHVALTRASGTTRLFVNGVQYASTATGGATNLSSPIKKIGGLINTTNSFNGKIDEFRVTVGVARYVSNFTPPSLPFPDQGPL